MLIKLLFIVTMEGGDNNLGEEQIMIEYKKSTSFSIFFHVSIFLHTFMLLHVSSWLSGMRATYISKQPDVRSSNLHPIRRSRASLAASMLAPLTPILLMGVLGSPFKGRRLHRNITPVLDTVGNPLSVALLIKHQLSQFSAFHASLMVDSCVVAIQPIFADGDGNNLTVPALFPALLVLADEAAHDLGVIGLEGSVLCILVFEGVNEIDFVEFLLDLIVKVGMHGP